MVGIIVQVEDYRKGSRLDHHKSQIKLSTGLVLKEYSVILIAPLYGINQKILTKKVVSKISVNSDFSFIQVMHDYVHWPCSIDYCVKQVLGYVSFC